MLDKPDYAPKGMFEISKPMARKDLYQWEEHFRRKGIKTEIVKDRSGKSILCREGVEAK